MTRKILSQKRLAKDRSELMAFLVAILEYADRPVDDQEFRRWATVSARATLAAAAIGEWQETTHCPQSPPKGQPVTLVPYPRMAAEEIARYKRRLRTALFTCRRLRIAWKELGFLHHFDPGSHNMAVWKMLDDALRTHRKTPGAFLKAIGRSRTPKAGTGVLSTVDGTPFFLQAEALKPFISQDLLLSTTPVFFRTRDGKKMEGKKKPRFFSEESA